jgi:hypothetical protein
MLGFNKYRYDFADRLWCNSSNFDQKALSNSRISYELANFSNPSPSTRNPTHASFFFAPIISLW